MRQPVQAIVAFPPGAHKAAERICLVFARVPAVLIHLSNRDLHRGVVLGRDQAVGGTALPRDIAVRHKPVRWEFNSVKVGFED